MSKYPRYNRKQNWPKPEEETFLQALFAFSCMAIFIGACCLLAFFLI